MSQAAILAAIKARLESVDGVENVHDYVRLFVAESVFKTLFVADSKVRGWCVSRIAAPSSQVARSLAKRVHRFRIEGFYGLEDDAASEKVFQSLVGAVMDDLDSHCGLGDVTTGASPAQLQTLDHRMFHKYLCHYAEILLDVPEDVTYSVG